MGYNNFFIEFLELFLMEKSDVASGVDVACLYVERAGGRAGKGSGGDVSDDEGGSSMRRLQS
jgi:hypothetical protein